MSTHARACALQLLRDLAVPLPNNGKGGRPRTFTPAQEVNILARIGRGETRIAIAADLGVCRETIGRLYQRALKLSLQTNTTSEST